MAKFRIVLIKFNNTKETIKCNEEIVKKVYVSDAVNNWRSKKIAEVKVNGYSVWKMPRNHKK